MDSPWHGTPPQPLPAAESDNNEGTSDFHTVLGGVMCAVLGGLMVHLATRRSHVSAYAMDAVTTVVAANLEETRRSVSDAREEVAGLKEEVMQLQSTVVELTTRFNCMVNDIAHNRMTLIEARQPHFAVGLQPPLQPARRKSGGAASRDKRSQRRQSLQWTSPATPGLTQPSTSGTGSC